jgi:hypothetical protein
MIRPIAPNVHEPRVQRKVSTETIRRTGTIRKTDLDREVA